MGSPYFATNGYASPLTPVIEDSHPDLPGQRATGLHQDNQRLAGLPSCVTPSLAYYQSGSRAWRRGLERPRRFGRLASPGSAWALLRGYGNINPSSIDYA